MSPKVSIVILNWNGRKYLERFLPSVCKSTYDHWELVVIDNASTDDSIEFLKENYPAVRIIVNKENAGFAGGYNSGLAAVESEYYVLLNSDVEVEAGWLEPMVRLLENDSRIAACQPSIMQFSNRAYYEYAGAAGGWLDRYGYPFAMGRIFDECEKEEGRYSEPSPIFWASGAALFIRSKIYWEMKGLDESFFAHQEEIDLCWRIQWAGYKIFSCPSSKVYHVGGGTLPKGNSKKVYLNFRNNLKMLGKNLPLHDLLFLIPIRLFLDAAFAWKSLFNVNDRGNFGAIMRAHYDFFKWVIHPKDRRWYPERKNKNWGGIYLGSVIWQYQIKKKKKFHEIVKNIH